MSKERMLAEEEFLKSISLTGYEDTSKFLELINQLILKGMTANEVIKALEYVNLSYLKHSLSKDGGKLNGL